MPRVALAAAVAEVARRDRDFARIIERAGPMRLRQPRDPDPFVELAETIVYQQLAGAAAAAIWRRVAAIYDGRAITPEAVLATPEATLRAAGLSGTKAASLRDLAAKVADGTVPLQNIRRLSDDRIVARLTQVRGIGRWSAEMFLIFTLRRLDVWPVDDYGVRTGWKLVKGLSDPPKPKELELEGEVFRPYRTVAAWYCWEAVHLARRGEG